MGHEYDWLLPDRKPDDNAQYIITSRNPGRVLQKIAQNAVDRELQLPSIALENANGLGRNVFQLKHTVYQGIPLRFKSTIQTLYVYARLFEKPASIETVASSSWIKETQGLLAQWYHELHDLLELKAFEEMFGEK